MLYFAHLTYNIVSSQVKSNPYLTLIMQIYLPLRCILESTLQLFVCGLILQRKQDFWDVAVFQPCTNCVNPKGPKSLFSQVSSLLSYWEEPSLADGEVRSSSKAREMFQFVRFASCSLSTGCATPDFQFAVTFSGPTFAPSRWAEGSSRS